ncbi:MAG: hypothetical protein ACXWDO_00340, partial [Bacteroidia bacterium]
MRTHTTKNTKTKLAVAFAALLSLAMAFDSNAQTIISTSQKWSDFGTTGFAAVPNTSTDIVINNGVTLQVDVTNAVCRDFTIGSSSSSNATLEFISANGSESKLTVGTTSAARDMYARGTANITFTNPSILVMTDDFS